MKILNFNTFLNEELKVRGFYPRAKMPELRSLWKIDKEFGDAGADVSQAIHEYTPRLRGKYYFITPEDGTEAEKMLDQSKRNIFFGLAKTPWKLFSNKLEYPNESRIAKTWLIKTNPDGTKEQISVFYAEMEGSPALIATDSDFSKLYDHDFSKELI
jgi:hypothetical protein